jgi:hypothetical protein|tara:strand:+ start:5329 stop:5607 length:279 start_codon:yes stop_codon:yes gene_type:complete
MLSSIRPINPSAFGPVKQQMPPQGMQSPPPQGMPPQGMPPQGMPPQGMPPQGQNPEGDKMTSYLMDKVEEIKKRLGQGDVGALSNVTKAMRG